MAESAQDSAIENVQSPFPSPSAGLHSQPAPQSGLSVTSSKKRRLQVWPCNFVGIEEKSNEFVCSLEECAD